jgi:protein TonB
MKKQVFIYAGMLLVIAQACNNNEKPAEVVTEVVVTDTVVKVVEVPTEIDSATVVAFYTAEHAKSKGTPNTKTKTKGTKKVSVDSDPPFASVDVIPTPARAAETTPAAPEVVVVHDVQMYYFIPDEKASFPGGEAAFDKYLLDNLQYPEKALAAGQSRTVYPTLFLDEQGNPTDVTFRYEPTIYGFQDEARRILMASPRWNPAKVGGQPVKSKFTIPISFKLN